MSAIRLDKLTKYYGKNRGIKDLSLEVEEGEFFGFIGPNGAGKSTTIRTMLGLISANSGSGEILGMDISRESTRLLADVGYLASETNFYDRMKVKDVIKLSADLRGVDTSKEAESLVERLSLDVNKRISELSLGNRKKVGIVCALAHKPKLCILDEPTSGLDPLMQKEFFKILQERNKEGATIFLSSHILSEVQEYCKRAAIIKDGSLVAIGDINKLSNTSAKSIRINGIDSLPESLLTGARNVSKKNAASDEDKQVTFLYSGEINMLIRELAKLSITDIAINEPDLEEVFMHYYES